MAYHCKRFNLYAPMYIHEVHAGSEQVLDGWILKVIFPLFTPPLGCSNGSPMIPIPCTRATFSRSVRPIRIKIESPCVFQR